MPPRSSPKTSAPERRAFERHEEELRLQASIVEYSVKEAERAKAELSQTRTIVIQRETELEEAKARVERAVRALAEKLGISEDDARKILE